MMTALSRDAVDFECPPLLDQSDFSRMLEGL